MKYRIIKREGEWHVEHKEIGGTGVEFWVEVCACEREEWAIRICSLLNRM